MIPKSFNEIGKEDIDLLLTTERSEDRSLDYKAALPDFNIKDKKRKFLALVSSFANTVGGDIVYGVSEKVENGKKTGTPGEITGIETDSADQTILQLENIIRMSMQPVSVPGVQVKAIDGFEKGPVIVIRVPQSATAPHMVWMDRVSQFYVRSSNSTNAMDVGEIRAAFNVSNNTAERVKQFRAERSSMIMAGETPIETRQGPKMVIHLIPYLALSSLANVDFIARIKERGSYNELYPYIKYSRGDRYNFDGIVMYGDSREKNTYDVYTQIFRSGIVEFCCNVDWSNGGFNFLSPNFEIDAIRNTEKYLERMPDYGISPPVIIIVSFLGVRGFEIYREHPSRYDGYTPIDRDVLFLPEIYLEDLSGDPADFYKPIFDTMWQACGYDGSENYDEEGVRIKPGRQ